MDPRFRGDDTIVNVAAEKTGMARAVADKNPAFLQPPRSGICCQMSNLVSSSRRTANTRHHCARRYTPYQRVVNFVTFRPCSGSIDECVDEEYLPVQARPSPSKPVLGVRRDIQHNRATNLTFSHRLAL
jgi:hypothetical protein